ncbi:MAG: gliding motility-associated ABC transporter ATP-binding subunit GldA, partial [Bacteroidota bacterium]
MSLTVENLTKIYGRQRAVDSISFSVQPGEILGFLGPNGAGKSTTMKIAACYLPPSEGTVEVQGYNVVDKPMAVRKNIGYLPEHNPLYLDLYVHEYLRFIGRLHGLRGKKLRSRVEEMVSLTGLIREQHKKIGALSKGYRQRVGLAQALIHNPSVLILDEPTTGLDPNQIVEIRKLIKDISQEKTVILSTHIMQEVQALCDRVVIINRGQLVADDTVDSLTAKAGGSPVLKVSLSGAVDEQKLRQLPGVHPAEALAGQEKPSHTHP